MTMTRRLYLAVLCLCLVLLWSPVPSLAKTTTRKAYKAPTEDPYRVLGVTSRSSMDAIKKAYRQKAKDLHPDKNPHKNAADQFRRVVDAWEFLNTPGFKAAYDNQKWHRQFQQENPNKAQRQQRAQNRQYNGFSGSYTFKSKTYTSKTYNSQGQEQSQQQQQQQRQEQWQKKQESHAQVLKDAKVAQERVLKLSTLEQLQTTLLDRNQRFKKHFFCVFVAGKRMEKYVDENLLFPYPFAGKPGRNGIQWESILQTAKVRYNRSTPLTKTFRLPPVEQSQRSGKPYLVFVRKGDRLEDFALYASRTWSPRQQYNKVEQWILQQLMAQVTIINRHHAPIQLYYTDGTQKFHMVDHAIPVGHQTTIQFKTADRIAVLDAHIDKFPGGSWNPKLVHQEDLLQSILLDDIVVTETTQTIQVEAGYGSTRTCYDLSLQCQDWIQKHKHQKQSVCETHYEFGHTICAKSCGVCIDSNYWSNAIYYILFHKPFHTIPTPLLRLPLMGVRAMAKTGDFFMDDMQHLWQMRRNVTVAFVVTGFLVGIQMVVLCNMILYQPQGRPRTIHDLIAWYNLGILLLLIVSLGGWGIWLSQENSQDVPVFLREFQRDLAHMVRFSMDAIQLIVYMGFLSSVISKTVTERGMSRLFSASARRNDGSSRIVLVLTLMMVSSAMMLGVSFLLENDILIDGRKAHRLIRWNQIWGIRKNVAASIFVLGILIGAFVLQLARLLWQSKKLVGVTMINGAVFLGGLVLAYSQDPYFVKDLNHVVHMRMSAAIPCAVVGMMSGMTLAHFLSTYQVKVKVD